MILQTLWFHSIQLKHIRERYKENITVSLIRWLYCLYDSWNNCPDLTKESITTLEPINTNDKRYSNILHIIVIWWSDINCYWELVSGLSGWLFQTIQIPQSIPIVSLVRRKEKLKECIIKDMTEESSPPYSAIYSSQHTDQIEVQNEYQIKHN